MASYFFPYPNQVNGRFVNVFGEKFDVREVKERDIRIDKDINFKRKFKNVEEYAEYCDLKKRY